MMRYHQRLALAGLFMALLFAAEPLTAKAASGGIPNLKQIMIGTHLHDAPVLVDEEEMRASLIVARWVLQDTGAAHGALHVKLPDETLHYRVLEGRARFADGDLTEVVLVIERIGRDGRGDETDLLIITPVTLPGGSDCLIYDFLGPNVSFETPNEIRFVNHH